MLSHTDGSIFAVGMCAYLDQDPGTQSETSRINVSVEFEGFKVLALLDTGAAWSVLDRDVAMELGLFDRAGEPKSIHSRYGTTEGKLVRISTTFVAQEGESFEMEATVFVSADWPAGSFVGCSGLLERVKFAVDPETNTFFFGPID